MPGPLHPDHIGGGRVVRTFRNCTVPVTSGKEKSEDFPETFSAQFPATCKSISATPSALVLTTCSPTRLATRNVCDISPSPRIAMP